VIYEILEAALPPLTDEDLRHLSDTIEHMDQTKQQIEQLAREQTALEKITRNYDAYNRFRLTETATQYAAAVKKFSQEEKLGEERHQEKAQLEQEMEVMTRRRNELEQQDAVLKQKEIRLRQHEVWNLEEEHTKETEKLRETSMEARKKEVALTAKSQRERDERLRLDTLQMNAQQIEGAMNDQLTDLTADADVAAFAGHTVNAGDFERHVQNVFDFSVWKKEAEQHYVMLEKIAEKLLAYEQMRGHIGEKDKVIADLQLEIDQKNHETKDWLHVFEKDKQEKTSEIYQWIRTHDFLNVDEVMVQQAVRGLDSLYEPTPFEIIRAPFAEKSQTYQNSLHETIATKTSHVKGLKEEIRVQTVLLEEWKNTRDPEPPNMVEETKQARKKLKEAGFVHMPFYEAVEFYDHVPEDVRNRLEAAIIDSGIINALITSPDAPVKHDRIIQPNPQMMAHTLADYLYPDTDETQAIPGAQIDEVLRSILVEADATDEMMIRTDGTYQIGLLEGHAVPVEKVRFIGKNARERYREEQMEQITDDIVRLEEEKRKLAGEIADSEELIHAARQAMDDFPTDADLGVSFDEIKANRFQIAQLDKQLLVEDTKRSDLLSRFQAMKRTLDAESKEINIAMTYMAFQEAKEVQRQYGNDVRTLENHHHSYVHNLENQQVVARRMAELETEVDELKGEVNILTDRITRTKHNIIEIEKQLATQGMDEIRKQIQTVQQQIAETSEELERNRISLPEKTAQQTTLLNEITAHVQRLQFAQVMIQAWETSFQEELTYAFIEVPDDDGMDLAAKAAFVRQTYREQEKQVKQLEDQLSRTFYEQHSDLLEYRMQDYVTAIPDIETDREPWTDDQEVLFTDWQNKATRRLIDLEFQGKRLSPYYVSDILREDQARQQTMLNEQDQQLYEEILFDSVGKKLRSRIHRAQDWTKKMNQLMVNNDSTSGITFSIQWKPRTAETEAELDTKELVELLRRDPRLLREDDLNQVMTHFRSKIDRAKELIDLKGEGSTLLQVLKEVLDYRYWFSFVLSFQRSGETKRELTNNAFFKFSGGEKAMAMYIPLFTACYSRYQEADADAPYIISLDEAFAGVDDENISVMFRIVEELGFDYMMNSQVLWGDYDTVSALAIYELIRPKNASFVSVIRYVWDGKVRRRVDEAEDKQERVTLEIK
jgi:uncharacterized protein (TIGR02680 family)